MADVVRVTRVAVEVLNKPTPPSVRVTRVAVEVLGSEEAPPVTLLPSVRIVACG